MANITNPFLYITPRDKESLVGRTGFLEIIEKKILESLDKSAVIAVNGEVGIGKTMFIEKVISKLESRKDIKVFKLDFNLNTLNDLRSIPTEKELQKQILIVIDRFELILSLTKEIQQKVLEVLANLCEAKVTIILATTTGLISKIFEINHNVKKFFNVLNVPYMNFEEVKKLVVSRLNEVRKEKSDKIEPFLKEELDMIYKNSKGNPRMVLMLCASLYEKKVSGE